MSLRSYFPSRIWSRGLEYYRKNCVKRFSSHGDLYTATVQGTRLYHVTIRVRGGKIAGWYCDCEYASDGSVCKHVAAVCAKIDQVDPNDNGEGAAAVRRPEKVHPFVPKPYHAAEDYRAPLRTFDLDRICKDVEVPQDMLERAQAQISAGTVKLTRIRRSDSRFAYGPECQAAGFVEVNSHRYELKASFDEHRLDSISCGCPNCPGYFYTPTVSDHTLALLLLARKELNEHPIDCVTSEEGSALIESFRKQTALERREEAVPAKEERHRTITLEPRVNLTDGELSVDFRVGEGRMYVVRNPRQLMEAEEQRTPLSISAKSAVDFAHATFTEESRVWYDWLRRAIEGEEAARALANRLVSYYRQVSEHAGSHLTLTGSRLDDFFDMTEGMTLESGLTQAKKITPVTRRADITLNLRPYYGDSGEELLGVKLTGKLPRTRRGAKYRYILEGENLIRIEPEQGRQLEPLFESTDGSELNMVIGRADMAPFYSHVVPALQQCVKLKEYTPEQIAPFLPPEAVYQFHLDAVENEVTCAPTVRCGEDSWTLERADAFYLDQEEREHVISTVSRYFPERDKERHVWLAPRSEDAVFDLLTRGVDELTELGEVFATDSFKALRVRRKWKLKAGVQLESDLLNLQLLSDDLTQEELREVLAAYAQRKRYHRLRSGEFVELDEEQMADLDALFQAAHVPLKSFVTGKMHLPAYRALYLDKLMEEHESVSAERDKRFRALVKAFKTVSDSDDEVPSSLTGVLRPYQEQGFKWLMTLLHCGFGGILADDMGLGKTLQMIAVLLREKEQGASGPSLIVCPASLVYNWQEECARFAPQLKAEVIAGTLPERRKLLSATDSADVLITSYDLLKRDVAEYEGIPLHIMVLDEAQYIKNHSSAAAKSVKAVQAAHRFALTGTPVENRLSELWSIFDFLMPGFLYQYEVFRREMETPIVRYEDKEEMERLRRMVGPFILRRLKTDVLRDLPAKYEETRPVKLEGEQRRLYDAQVAHLKNMLAEKSEAEFDRSKVLVLAELTRLRQICCDPSLMAAGYEGASAKREALRDLVRSAIDGGHKMLIFSQFTSMLALLQEDLKAEGIEFMLLTGETPKHERVDMTRRFNTGDTPVFLISLKAGGTGLNLTGADIVIHYDPWWNLAVQNQATDRAHRIGQEKPVTVYRLIARDTIEDRIVKLQETKRDLAEGILSGEHASLAGMSREELMELIG